MKTKASRKTMPQINMPCFYLKITKTFPSDIIIISIESKIKYTSKSISLPTEKWDELEIKAQEQGITKNKLVADLIEKYLKKNRRKNEKNKTKK